MSARRAISIGLVMLLALPLPALASASNGTLAGVVKSWSGSTLANVDIEFVNLTSGATRTIRTDGGGVLRGMLDSGSYTVEAPGYAIVSGPRTVSLELGDAISIDLTLRSQDPAAPSGGSESTQAAGGGKSKGDIVALALFGSALTGVVIRAATVQDRKKPPTTSPSR